MDVKAFVEKIHDLGIQMVTGVPDSTLKPLCDYICTEGKDFFEHHVVAANEGAAIGVAIGEYLSTGNVACVYMQNSGLGNAVNPITSLANTEVYGIPMLLLVGWRGEPGTKDEPQHKFMGKITTSLLEILDIAYAIVDAETTDAEIAKILEGAKEVFSQNRQYALVIKRGAFDERKTTQYQNNYPLEREKAIEKIVKWLQPEDLVISTTGKISRELYEKSNDILGGHAQSFLVVGGMGHANMIAYQLAKRKESRRVICVDGDGALLMHMGSLAVLGKNPIKNLVHICLNNEAHESVGGMPTGAVGISYSDIAKSCGYVKVYCVKEEGELLEALAEIRTSNEITFLEIDVAISSRLDLGRPKEAAEENKTEFMRYQSDVKEMI